MNPIIKKYAAVIIDNSGRYLIAKDKDESFWKNVGGQAEQNESPEDCLKREIKSELDCEVIGEPEYYFSCPITPRASHPDLKVEIILYKAQIAGTPTPSGETGEIHWLTKSEFLENKFEVTQQLKDFIIPKLIEDGLLK
jgi:ADP-ribose pyrophosphatase YjhB (NUDIX family)